MQKITYKEHTDFELKKRKPIDIDQTGKSGIDKLCENIDKIGKFHKENIQTVTIHKKKNKIDL
jgi:hypothetical protein